MPVGVHLQVNCCWHPATTRAQRCYWEGESPGNSFMAPYLVFPRLKQKESSMFWACRYPHVYLSIGVTMQFELCWRDRIVSLVSSRPNVSRVSNVLYFQDSIFLNFFPVVFFIFFLSFSLFQFSLTHYFLGAWFELPCPETLPLWSELSFTLQTRSLAVPFMQPRQFCESLLIFWRVTRPDDPVATGTRRGLLLLWRARSLPRWRTGNLRLWAGPASMISMGVWACWRGWLYSRISSLKCGMLTPFDAQTESASEFWNIVAHHKYIPHTSLIIFIYIIYKIINNLL